MSKNPWVFHMDFLRGNHDLFYYDPPETKGFSYEPYNEPQPSDEQQAKIREAAEAKRKRRQEKRKK